VNNDEISVEEILEELDPLGRALFDAALGRVRLKRTQAQLQRAMERIGELERQKGGTPDGD
jgi:hypothetical protein